MEHHSLTLIERWVEKLCLWLADRLPRQHAVAAIGSSIVGLPALVMPVDRRLNLSHMSGESSPGDFGAQRGPSQETWRFKISVMRDDATVDRCEFWAYCSMSGHPCVLCGGSNAGDMGAAQQACPASSVPRTYWSGCCFEPQAGRMRYVGWLDCGTPTSRMCSSAMSYCHNYPGVKDWSHPLKYYCTVAVTESAKDRYCEP